ncbi:MAG: SPOR domain-containing protein [Gallionella sp.]|nr:SPOR domain-containing protein [Gallionella sp.]
MRTLVWILLLGNLVLFAVMQRGGLNWGEQAYQVQPALQAEKIRLLDASQIHPLDVTGSAPIKVSPGKDMAAIPVEAPAQMVASAPALAPAPAAKLAPADDKQGSEVCLEWGEFSGNDLKRVSELLSTLHLGAKLTQRQIDYNKGYWVFIPPLKDRAEVNQKISQLKARGVKEYFVVQEAGDLRYAISLGVFKTQEAAQNHLKELRTQDVRTAQVGERASRFSTTLFMLDKVDALTEAKLTALKKDFTGSELKNVPCALTR